MFNQFLTKENIVSVVVIAALVVYFLISSNIFATRLQLSELRNEVLQQKIELQQYSDKKDAELLDKIDQKYEKIISMLNTMKYSR